VKRQRFRCHPADGSSPHKFVPPVTRLISVGAVCGHCGNPVPAHQGPSTPRRYEFPVLQAAEALVMVGQGMSYTETADRLRSRNSRDRFECGAQLVANWVEVLTPVVAAEWKEDVWPETVVLDSTRFQVENRRTGTSSLAFHVLGAFGYEHGAASGRTLALHATPAGTNLDWIDLLQSRGGMPAMVVCDDDSVFIKAVRSVWPLACTALPQHHSNGDLEQVIRDVRAFMAPRSFCYRNAERTNLMLELVRLNANHNDEASRYAAAIRMHLDLHDGQLEQQGTIRDRRGQNSLRI
jgi:hypothetical protein